MSFGDIDPWRADEVNFEREDELREQVGSEVAELLAAAGYPYPGSIDGAVRMLLGEIRAAQAARGQVRDAAVHQVGEESASD